MNLVGFDLYRYDLPLVEPLTLGGTTFGSRRGLLIRLTDTDGREGWGEAAPLPGFSRETLEEAARQLHGLSDTLPGTEVSPGWWSPENTSPWPNDENLAPSARFALELAAWNLLTPAEEGPEMPVEDSRKVVPINGLISSLPERALDEAFSMAESGYRAVKLKVGGSGISEDVRLVRAVREAVGGDVELRLDANRAWGFGEAMEFARDVTGVEIAYVEEPLSEPGRLAELAAAWGLPVALDESLVGMEPGELGGRGHARAVVLKPTLLGGISRTLALAGWALRLGMTPVVSASYESGVGTAALVALAAAIEERPASAGLDTYRRLAADVILEPLDLPAPSIDLRRATIAARKVDTGRLEPV